MEQAGLQLIAEGLATYLGSMDKAESANTSFYGSLDAGQKHAGGFQEVITGALRHVGELAVDALGKATQAVGSFIKDSVTAAGDFEAGMNEFRAVAGADVDAQGVQEFHDLFISLGKDLPVSTSEVQQAAIEMVKGGIDPATIAAGGLRQNIQFAAAAMDGDLAGAAEISAKILGGWADANATAADKSAFLTKSTDLLTKAANASSVDVHELSLGIFNAQGIAKTAGVSFEDLTTTLAEIAPRFASSSEAGNSLKNVIARLQPTTKPAIAAMKGLGLITKDGSNAFYDAQGNFIGFKKTSQLLQNSLKGLTKQQQQQVLQTIFGNDAMNAAAALAEEGSDGYQKMADSLDKANGVQANAALKQQGYNTALENAKGSIEALQITLGEKLLPVLTTLLTDYIAPGINAFTDLASAVFGDGEAFGKLPGPLQAVIGFFAPLVQWVQTALGYFFDLDGKAQGISSALAVMGGKAGEVTQILSPFQQIVQTVGGYFQSTILPIFQNLATAIFPLWGAAVQVAAGFWSDVLLPAVQALWDILSTFVIPILADVAAWLAVNLPPAIAAVAGFLTGTLFPALHDVYSFISTDVVPVLGDVRDWLEKYVPAAIQVAADFWNNTLQPALAIAAQWLGTNIPIAIQAMVGFWNTTLLPALNAGWSFLTTYIFPAFAAAWTWLSTTIPTAVQTTSDFWNNTLLPAFRAVSDFLNTYIFPFFQALANVHMAIVNKTAEAMAGIWQKVLLPAFTDVYNFLNTLLSPFLAFLANDVLHKVETTTGEVYWVWQNMLLPALRTVWGFLQGKIQDVLKDFSKWLGNVVGAINGVGGAVRDVISWLAQLAAKIASIHLPDWMTPGSPTPWEIGLRGVGAALKTVVNPQIDALYRELRVAPIMGAQQILGATAAGNTTITNSRQINMPVTTNLSPAAITQSGAVLNALLT